MSKNRSKVNPLWGGRFEEGASNLTQAFTSSIEVDKALYEVDVKGSIAYAEALRESDDRMANVLRPDVQRSTINAKWESHKSCDLGPS